MDAVVFDLCQRAADHAFPFLIIPGVADGAGLPCRAADNDHQPGPFQPGFNGRQMPGMERLKPADKDQAVIIVIFGYIHISSHFPPLPAH